MVIYDLLKFFIDLMRIDFCKDQVSKFGGYSDYNILVVGITLAPFQIASKKYILMMPFKEDLDNLRVGQWCLLLRISFNSVGVLDLLTSVDEF